MNRRINILYLDQPLNNRGDESAHRGIINWLNHNYPEAQIDIVFWDEKNENIREFIVESPQNSYVNIQAYKGAHFALIKGIKNPVFWRLHPTTRQLIKLIKQSDFVICSPGGVNLGGFQGWEHMAQIKIAQWLKKPTIYYGRSVGPFPTDTESQRLFLKLSKELLKQFTYLSVRDKVSSDTLSRLGISHSLTVDSAFLSDPDALLPPDIKNTIGDNYAVIVPNVLHWHYAFKKVSHESMLQFYTGLLSRLKKAYPGTRFVMLPQTYNEVTRERKDYLFFKEIADHMNDSDVIAMPETLGSDIQQTIIRGAKFLIGSRYHSVVFAINQSTPFVALSYEHKIAGLADILGLTDCYIPIDGKSFASDTAIDSLIEQCISRVGIIDVKVMEKARQKAKTIAHERIADLKKIIM